MKGNRRISSEDLQVTKTSPLLKHRTKMVPSFDLPLKPKPSITIASIPGRIYESQECVRIQTKFKHSLCTLCIISMGISDLKNFLRNKRIPKPINPRQFLPGMRVAVDLQMYLYQMAYHRGIFEQESHSEQSELLVDEMKKMQSWFHEMKAEPVYILDGFHKPLKDLIINARLASRAKAVVETEQLVMKAGVVIEKIEKVLPEVDVVTKVEDPELVEAYKVLKADSKSRKKVENPEQIQKVQTAEKVVIKKLKAVVKSKTVKEEVQKAKDELKQVEDALKERKQTKTDTVKSVKKSFFLKGAHFSDIRSVLTAAGATHFNAVADAESQCAYLCRQDVKIVNAVCSDDYDTLAFGAPYLLSGLHRAVSDQNNVLFFVSMPSLLESLELQYDDFLDLCVVCGCEYIDGVKGGEPKGKVEESKNARISLAGDDIEEIAEALKYRSAHGIYPDHVNLSSKNDKLSKLLAKLETPEYKVAKEYFRNPDVYTFPGIPGR